MLSLERIVENDDQIYIYKCLAEFYRYLNGLSTLPLHRELSVYGEKEQSAYQEIKKRDASFTIPEKTSNNSGCYVATAIYGSYDCPQVWTLRRFRDDCLAKSWYGRTFIRTYYTISPTLVKWFGHTAWFKNMWKPTLDRMVRRLNNI